MSSRRRATAALVAVGALGAIGATAAVADHDNGNRQAIDTRADYTPFDQFRPLGPRAPAPAR